MTFSTEYAQLSKIDGLLNIIESRFEALYWPLIWSP